MKSPRDNQPPFPVRDYSLALQTAVSWLGDRYLLATPVMARSHYTPQSWRRYWTASSSASSAET